MKKKTKSFLQAVLSGTLVWALVLAMSGLYLVPGARAAALTSKSDTMSRLQVSTDSDHEIEFTTPTGVAADATITVTFPALFDLTSVDETDMDLEDDTVGVTLAATPTGTTWGAAVSGQAITFTNGSAAVAAGSVINIKIGQNATGGGANAQIENTSATGDAAIAIAGTFGDSGSMLVEMLTDDTVHITATVDESLNFSISDVEIGFGDLSSGAARYATADESGDTTPQVAHNLVAGTNASGGYVITVTGTTLTSAAADEIDAIGGTHAASSVGTEQFGLRLAASGGSGAATDPYDDAAQFAYDGVSAPDQVASAAGASADTTYSAYYLANIAANTEAGLYETDLTYIATATY